MRQDSFDSISSDDSSSSSTSTSSSLSTKTIFRKSILTKPPTITNLTNEVKSEAKNQPKEESKEEPTKMVKEIKEVDKDTNEGEWRIRFCEFFKSLNKFFQDGPLQ